ncbi:MAG: hypothetical protein ACYCTB_02620 [bacterium]
MHHALNGGVTSSIISSYNTYDEASLFSSDAILLLISFLVMTVPP